MIFRRFAELKETKEQSYVCDEESTIPQDEDAPPSEMASRVGAAPTRSPVSENLEHFRKVRMCTVEVRAAAKAPSTCATCCSKAVGSATAAYTTSLPQASFISPSMWQDTVARTYLRGT